MQLVLLLSSCYRTFAPAVGRGYDPTKVTVLFQVWSPYFEVCKSFSLPISIRHDVSELLAMAALQFV